MSQFCVLVASSDNRKDIFNICFAHSRQIWEDCDWPRYIGLTTPHEDQYGFKVVTSPQHEWRRAVAGYIDALPSEIRYILLMVEDTLFLEPIDAATLARAANWLWSAGLPYLRLTPIRRSWIGKMMHAMRMRGDKEFEIIPPTDPYYSSTEMAIWKRDYLRKLLDLPADAWTFERHVSSWEHRAVTIPVFNQHQIVQKGRWNRVAPRLLARQGISLDSRRPFQTRLAWLRGKWQNLNFALFGFATLRIRRWFTN